VAEEHSKQSGSRPLVLSAELFTEHDYETGERRTGTRITIELPKGFDWGRVNDVSKDAARLLRDIRSAANIFFADT
jgi:hypothetical protein